jgi:hypothetical protein
VRAVALALFAATCTQQPSPAPAPTAATSDPPTIVTVTPAPAPVDAGPPCASGCAAAQTACPKPNHTATECEANCRDVVRYGVQTASCAARVFTCELGCP